ncbi:MAG: bifunctional metallophosphatase/5'-nucleotidase [Sneathiella sp.]|nr:bifunctional metallophosphatase/5'-nucleotidase [Sneathiella sp.]
MTGLFGTAVKRQVVFILSILLFSVSFANAEKARITFLHTNDMGEIAGKPGFGGFPELATLIRQERRRNPNAIATFGGDLISPSLMSGLSKGAEMVEMMNALKIDVAVLGNHEFDFGEDVTRARVKQSEFPWLASNVSMSGGDPLGSQMNAIREVGGYKIGFFGITTPHTVDLSSPSDKVRFGDIISAAEGQVEELRSVGADIVVALTHMNYADDLRLAREVPGIDVLLGGHDHRVIALQENDVSILQAGSDLRYLGVLDLDVERLEKRGKQVLQIVPTWRMLATRDVAPSADIASKVAAFEKSLNEELNIEIGRTDIELDTRRTSVRGQQTVFGTLIAAAMRDKVSADFGFTNGGGIRGDRTYEAGSILTRRDILKELPFGNVTVSVKLSGSDVAKLVEHSVSEIEEGAGRFAQFAGLTYDLDVTKPVGQRTSNIKINGAMLDTSKTYIAATNDYVAKGGDGYAMLKDAPKIVDAAAGELMASTVIDAIKKMGVIRR